MIIYKSNLRKELQLQIAQITENLIMIEIDGGILEGGGQIFRMSILLSYLLKKPITISNIRQNRPKPGLSGQHLTGLTTFSVFSDSSFSHAEIGSKQVIFYPKKQKIGSHFSIEQKTPGAISLVFQMVFPALLFHKESSSLSITGGVNMDFSPPALCIQQILLPLLKKMNIFANYDIEQFEQKKMLGKVNILVNSVKHIENIEMVQRGEFKKLHVFIVYNQNQQEIKDQIIKDFIEKYNDVEFHENKQNVDKISSLVKLEYTQPTALQINTLISAKNFKKQIYSIQENVKQIMEQTYAVEEHLSDQLLIFMALARGKSCISVQNDLSLHTRTMCYLLEKILGVKIEIFNKEEKQCIQIEGIGFEIQHD